MPHEEDLYFEEVDTIVDSIVDRIKDGELTSREAVDKEVHDAVGESSYACQEMLCAVALLYSKYPTAYFAEFGFDTKKEGITAGGTADFPFEKFAAAAMHMDVMGRLSAQRLEFQALPNSSADAAEETDDEDEGEEDDD